MQAQAQELGQAAAAMPMRVARIEQTLSQLEAGDLKLRVRVLEGERADRRSGMMQVSVRACACRAVLGLAGLPGMLVGSWTGVCFGASAVSAGRARCHSLAPLAAQCGAAHRHESPTGVAAASHCIRHLHQHTLLAPSAAAPPRQPLMGARPFACCAAACAVCVCTRSWRR